MGHAIIVVFVSVVGLNFLLLSSVIAGAVLSATAVVDSLVVVRLLL